MDRLFSLHILYYYKFMIKLYEQWYPASAAAQ